MLVFGAILPVFLILMAGIGLWGLQNDRSPDKDDVVRTFTSMQKAVSNSGDLNAYALASFVYAEHSNFDVVHEKQRM